VTPKHAAFNVAAPKHASSDNCRQPIIRLNEHPGRYYAYALYVALLIKPPIILRLGKEREGGGKGGVE
jgi:hypothetical protein